MLYKVYVFRPSHPLRSYLALAYRALSRAAAPVRAPRAAAPAPTPNAPTHAREPRARPRARDPPLSTALEPSHRASST